MQQCIARHPSAQLTLLGTRIGAKVAKAVLMSVAAGRLTPEVLSEALQSSSTVRGHVQREAVKLLVVRVSMRTPQQLQWLLQLVGDCLGGLSLTGAISSLTQRSLMYQVANFGMRGSAASAITTAAVQIGLTTCTLVTTNAAFWRKGDHKMSMQQYRYELLTSFYTGVGSVAGGAAGAAAGSMVMPGLGTAFGSVLCSVGVGYVPGYLRDKRGPDDRRRQQAMELQQYTPLRMLDTHEEAVLMYKEELVETVAATCTTTTAATAAANITAHAVAPTTSAAPASSNPAEPSQPASTEVKSASSEEDAAEEEGEVVWLDLVRATIPSSTTAAPASFTSTAGHTEERAGSHATSPASASASSWDGVGEEARLREGTTGMRSFLRFSPSFGLPTSAREAVDGHAEAAVLSVSSSVDDVVEGTAGAGGAGGEGDCTERFQGHAKYISVATAEELEAAVAKFGGEDDLMLVFAEKK
ncbi:putative mitochondrial mitochondrial carrier protein [Leptomonas pyrrhocoris]|uniref:Putative mitochondrial mitochondrial carrier protein n=1 Tax=Leptomonas pyrrhocoris TaxID=157538 RepID=A0A0N0DVN0_LEPPY|nr:putative mitochondrial mitochondrial carrier protein [Leptomonas pyrrhocoris]KPA80331.1 putative mitochondrial mitochondrial carrier protein [Leptomonas pyrrhocoris]|eukprot:XP_015658770.1 putative mitochondrial mitochondrial carrier protein [Leptomonas pyrrhocoris]